MSDSIDSEEVVSSIKQVYERFRIPENLQLHMYRVASVGELICDNWNGKELDEQSVKAALLLHDLGNIVKFDFDKGFQKLVMGKEAEMADYWMDVQKEVITKYGKDEHKATLNMIEESGVDRRLRFLIGTATPDNSSFVKSSSDYALKICYYSDIRVGPFGVLSVEQRFGDLIERRKGTELEKLYKKVFATALEIEKEVLTKLRISAADINDSTIKPYLSGYIKSKTKS